MTSLEFRNTSRIQTENIEYSNLEFSFFLVVRLLVDEPKVHFHMRVTKEVHCTIFF